MIDVRSDTVTTPTPEMRRAMYEAEVGDDVFQEDPTINRLEETGAEMLGKEAALFVPSGTMANLVALLAHGQRGQEIIVGAGSHIYVNEVGGMSALGGMFPRPLPDAEGFLDPAEVDAAVRTVNIHYPPTALICVENTHNVAGGTVSSLAQMEAVTAVARKHDLKAHLDGARLFNAAAYLGVSPKAIAAPFDSVYICLSKGLGAPVGSLTTGTAEFVASARKYRKMLGGGMRQAGIIAAAGLVSLNSMVKRLPEDHATARHIAEALVSVSGVDLDLSTVQTNIIRLNIGRKDLTASQVSHLLREQGVLANATGPQSMRLVTHYQVSMADADGVIAAFRNVMEAKHHAAPAAAGARPGAY